MYTPQKSQTQSLLTAKTASFISTSIEGSLESKFFRFLLTLLYDNQKRSITNKLSRSEAFETNACSKWTNSSSGVGFVAILDCYNQ